MCKLIRSEKLSDHQISGKCRLSRDQIFLGCNLVSTKGRTRAQVETKSYVAIEIEVATEHLGCNKNNSFKRMVKVAITQLCHEITC